MHRSGICTQCFKLCALGYLSGTFYDTYVIWRCVSFYISIIYCRWHCLNSILLDK